MRLISILFITIGGSAWAESEPLAPLGSASLGVLGFQAYDTILYTPSGQAFDWTAPMALEINYERDFSAEILTQTTREEIARIEGNPGDLDRVINTLADCMRDVSDGDQFVANAPTPDQIEFSLNGTTTCNVTYPNLRKRFLSIWLSDDSRFPRLSRQLRGG
ncbi:hypothetical protein BVC71_11635 [Marivivens niveibacter]|uniref:Chalcone isomerase domain-containing protein n=1 Tax=Marivivens niveibacter TaxID=1930667 RepID=A0A251WWT4_9RHOB|nr:hypothetical protein [Marivivens niveibacter]OUD08588.1 hypothetical protein BVC71_11635 [Marivivens niveibacter]